ncbi:hypothetical protein GCM10028895_51130 [Pontibacter rugosus]
MKEKVEIGTQLISLVLVVLWVYAAVSKLQEFEAFAVQLLRQPFPDGWAAVLVWALPGVELGAAALLVFRRTRGEGLLVSLGLLLLFTGYVGLAVAGVWEDLPCACGGILNSLGWGEHLVFNLIFTVLAGAGLYMWKKKKQRLRGRRRFREAAYRSGGR